MEASTATSIILAAIMLKLGGYGVLRFMIPAFNEQVHIFFRPFVFFICIIGIIYGGLNALRQVDLKRQIAFSSIAHMSVAILRIFTFTQVGMKGAVYMMISHGLTSASLFYSVGVLSDRYHTRSIFAYGGLLSVMPLFSFFFIGSSLVNVGFPGTSGFLPEFFILTAVAAVSPKMLFSLGLGMLFTTAGALLVMLRLLFGHLKTCYSSSNFSDINRLEFFIFSFLFF